MERGVRHGVRHGEIITLYVGNLPQKLHWSGLRQAFGRHGDLVDSYIANKVNREGKRFGFVRYSNKVDASRAIERLNGFKLYGYRLLVSFARFNARTSFWRRKRTISDPNRQTRRNISNGRSQDPRLNQDTTERAAVNQWENGKHDNGREEKLDKGEFTNGSEKTIAEGMNPELQIRKIKGYVDNENLWKLGKCLVGMMATVCSTESVKDRLHRWGLGDTMVKSLGGQKFLLQIKDEELFKILEEQKWSLLEEVFIKIEYWFESLRTDIRITWVEIRGIPLHCWNYETFKRIVEGWGRLIAMGENGDMSKDGERVTLLISTDQIRRIEEVALIEVGKEEFNIWVFEIPVLHLHCSEKKTTPETMVARSEEDESSSSSSVAIKSWESKSRNCEHNDEIDLEDVNSVDRAAVDMGKNNTEFIPITVNLDNSEEEKSLDGEKSFGGHQTATRALDISNSVGPDSSRPSWADMVRKSITNNTELEAPNPVLDRIREDVESMGLGRQDSLFKERNEGNSEIKSPNEELGHNKEDEGEIHSEEISETEEREENFESPENRNSRKIQKRKERRFGSLFELQDKVLSELERRKRDRVLKRIKKKGKENEKPELEGCSVTDLDLQERRRILLREAKKTLATGSLCGIEIRGDVNEAVEELISLAEKDQL
ncbi:hypothetical protein GQ457_01G010310 [Hibiscus cannabinus]